MGEKVSWLGDVGNLSDRLVALVKSLLGKGGKTDFQVRQSGIRRTWKSVVPFNQQAVTLRVVIESLLAANPLNQKSPKRGEGEKTRWDHANPLGFRVVLAAKCG